MKKFMDKDFLLKSDAAKHLYHDFAEALPIYDYHCHLSPKEIAENKRFSGITEMWLGGDHYKWRYERCMGVPEEKITGDAGDFEKFEAYCKAVSVGAGNPLYHWSHLELKRYFGIEDEINEFNAKEIYDKANKIITGDFSAKGAVKMSNVELIGTTDDPFDSLEYHRAIREDKSFETRVVPTFRPDKAIYIENADFVPYMEKNGIKSFADLKVKLSAALDKFATLGSKISDHSLTFVPFKLISDREAEEIFAKGLNKAPITSEEIEGYKTSVMLFLAGEYAHRSFVMQLHMGALRNNNAVMFKRLGADAGFDSMNDESVAFKLSRLLDEMNKSAGLPKTVVYSLNPKDNYMLGSMAGNFWGDGIKGKVQLGSAWWFNDHITGMTDQMKAYANLSSIGAFIGMTTDSRSFLSYPRHEYFRRIFCNILGEWVDNGEFTSDDRVLKTIVEGVCYKNALEFFEM